MCKNLDTRSCFLLSTSQDFFNKLMTLFRTCKVSGDSVSLQLISDIVRGIILLDSPVLIEKIICDDFFMDISEYLGYDPDMPLVHHHKEHVVFREGIPIKDPLIKSKINLPCRVRYLMAILLRESDQAAMTNINSMINLSNAEVIVYLLKEDGTFIQELFSRLKSSETSADSMKDLVSFIYELCRQKGSLRSDERTQLFRILANEGIFDIIGNILRSEDGNLKKIASETLILFCTEDKDPSLLRHYITRLGVQILGLLVEGMVADFGHESRRQYLDVLCRLLDTSTSGENSDAIIELFYDKHLGQLIGVIKVSTAQPDERSAEPEVLLRICELLRFCIRQHPSQIKRRLMVDGVLSEVLFLTRRKENHLVVSAVQFVRDLISHGDEDLRSHIVKSNALKPVIDAFVRNGKRKRDNLLQSVILSLLDYCEKKHEALLKYVVEAFWDQLVNFENIPSIRSLKDTYEQIKKCPLEKEKDYSTAACSSSLSPLSLPVRLVDYEDDEDDEEEEEEDEDYKLPPDKQTEETDKYMGGIKIVQKGKSDASVEENQPLKMRRITLQSKGIAGCISLRKVFGSQDKLPQSVDAMKSSSEEKREEGPVSHTDETNSSCDDEDSVDKEPTKS